MMVHYRILDPRYIYIESSSIYHRRTEENGKTLIRFARELNRWFDVRYSLSVILSAVRDSESIDSQRRRMELLRDANLE